MTDPIRDIFKTANVDLARDDVWQVQQATVVKHKALERLAAALRIQFAEPRILRAERDEAVILVTGQRPDGITEWSVGEACVDVNYRISGKMAAYVWAMAEKRAKDRVILKLAGLHGVYSEDESDEFKEGRKSDGFVDKFVAGEPVKSSAQAKREGDWPRLTGEIDRCDDTACLLRWWTPENRKAIAQLKPDWREEIVEYWRKAVAEKLAAECHSPAEIKHWEVQCEPLFGKLPHSVLEGLLEIVRDALAYMNKAMPEAAE